MNLDDVVENTLRNLGDDKKKKLEQTRLPLKTVIKKIRYLSNELELSSCTLAQKVVSTPGVLKYDLSSRVPLYLDTCLEEGFSKEQAANIFLSYPSVVGYESIGKKLRQKKRIGKLLDHSEEEVIQYLSGHPVSIGYSQKRDLGVLQVIDEINSSGLQARESILRTNISRKSPYVKGSQLPIREYRRENGEISPELMPPLYHALI